MILYSSGIVKVKDLISEERQLIDLNHYCTFHYIKYNFIHTLSIRKAIPTSWIDEVTSKTENGRSESWDVNLILKNNSSDVNLLTASTKNNI